MDEQDTRFSGWVLLEDDKIAATGEGRPPACAEVLDGEGGVLTPGLIDIHSHLGLYEDGLGFEGADGNEDTDPVTPQLRAIDGINPMDRGFQEARESGVTTVAVSPGSANPIGGQIALLKTAGRRVDDMVLKAPLAVKFALGENPKVCYRDKEQAPMTRMATASLIRDQLRKAERYLDDKERADEDEDFDLPEYDAKCEALIPVLEREQKAFFHAHRADDIFTAIRIAREFKLDLVIVHCTEGHLVRDILAAEGVKAIAGPVLCDRSKPELRNLSVEGPALLHEAGIHAALCTDHPVIPIQYLPLCAGLTIGAGLDREEALKSITIYAAEVAGISDRVGSLAPGKDADLVIYDEDADPCGPYAHPCMVFINGQQVV